MLDILTFNCPGCGNILTAKAEGGGDHYYLPKVLNSFAETVKGKPMICSDCASKVVLEVVPNTDSVAMRAVCVR